MTIQRAMNTSLSRMRQPFTRSALDKNFKARASSKKPRETFTAFNQPPAFPSIFMLPGKNANNAKGKANAIENPSIPNKGP